MSKDFDPSSISRASLRETTGSKTLPVCEVVHAFEDADASMVVYSSNESAMSLDGAGFWSNKDGWTTLNGATRFTPAETRDLALPISLGYDAQWSRYSEACISYGEPV